jgi:hypothetical protein
MEGARSAAADTSCAVPHEPPLVFTDAVLSKRQAANKRPAAVSLALGVGLTSGQAMTSPRLHHLCRHAEGNRAEPGSRSINAGAEISAKPVALCSGNDDEPPRSQSGAAAANDSKA